MNMTQRRSQQRLNKRAIQKGATMIELLVAFVIFSFGMLGVAGLQTKTISFSQASLQRSQASALTDDILDRLRADRLGALAQRWNSDRNEDSGAATRTGANIGVVATDLADWKRQVENLLPAGQASIAVSADPASLGVVTIEIFWDDSGGRDDALVFKTVSRL
jgi:type IV pilus assembly protein PilV